MKMLKAKQLLLLFAAAFILYAALAFKVHNHFDHIHDETCEIYILEQYFIPLLVDLTPIVLVGFIYKFELIYKVTTYKHKESKWVNSRAPPRII